MIIAPEGWSNIAFPLAGSLIFWAGWRKYRKITVFPALVCALITLIMIFFFRDPPRKIAGGQYDLISPADGKVLPVTEYTLESGEKRRMLSIFLSPLNVHINRSAVKGVVEKVEYRKGRHLPAYKGAAGSLNEMNIITVDCEHGEIIMRQVVGTIARRVVCHLKPGQTVGAGDRIGLMKFGSRFDIIIPDNVELKVVPGQKVKAGQSIIGVWIENR